MSMHSGRMEVSPLNNLLNGIIDAAESDVRYNHGFDCVDTHARSDSRIGIHIPRK